MSDEVSELHGGVAVTASALRLALDCVATPTFLLAADSAIVHANAAGALLLSSSKALRRTRSHLLPRRAAEARMMSATMARVIGEANPALLRLLGRNGDVSVLVTLTPVPAHAPAHALVVACIVDLHGKIPPIAPWLEDAFEISIQNAELAEGLMSGLTLNEFSEETGVTMGALRTRLKKLFGRTGKRSQAALVSALLRAAAIAPIPGSENNENRRGSPI